jgi:hypothetical protein
MSSNTKKIVLGTPRRLASVDSSKTPATYDDTIRWPIWKTGLLVVGLCVAFWAGAALLIVSFLG